ncbi:phosphotransferase [Octadecabacter sp. G9-8]|uniref:Phosphotransferase n=1 Tax=Octadecabacter dasysiphoniae TaxID=2909341 RepID=A0ABS9CYM1_9RHOB|nr:phosphotransferase [Octadecabacter dasysiphoniae]MCF2871500.1 phosphotransferase [Octadecabacter dasysiphoniae]
MRSEIVSDWLARTDWANWHRNAMTGDASARRYERLTNGHGMNVILMDAPPDTCGSQSRFVEIAKHLRGLGLAAPQILDWDDGLGLMILEDLGEADFAKHLKSSPTEERELYEAAVDTLLALQSVAPPKRLDKMTPAVAADMIDIAFDWAAIEKSTDLAAELKANIHDLLKQVDPSPSVLSLRDFHAENLIWRPDHQGLSTVGLLDFQDAFVTHPTYDLASLLRDARRDVNPELLDILLPRLISGPTDRTAARSAFHVIAIQRNLRILGIFNRLARHNGKTGYLDLIPRVRAHLRTDLEAPICADIAPLIERAFGTWDASS